MMSENKMVKVTFENQETVTVPSGTTLLELSRSYE